MTALTNQPAPAPSSGATGIRIATAVVGGAIAVLAIGAAAIGQFGIAGATTTQSTEPIPANVTSIDIANTIGDVSVFTTPGAQPSVEIRVDAFALNRMMAPQLQVDGDELSIEVPERTGPCFFACWGSVTILVELGDRSLDELDLSSDVGTVVVHEGVVVRDLTIESSVGDVMVLRPAATTIDVRSDVGSLRIEPDAATREITATTSVGDIDIRVQPGVDYDTWASSQIGDVVNDLASSTSATQSISATSDIGNVRISVIR